MSKLGDIFLVLWFLGILLGVVAIGFLLNMRPESLIGGGVLGSIVGFWGFALLVGWSLVMIVVGSVAVVSIIVGGWSIHEFHKSTTAPNPRYVTWRLIFGVLTVIPVIVIVLLLIL